MTTRYFSSLIEQSLSRSTEATLSIMGVTNPNLRELSLIRRVKGSARSVIVR